MTDHAINTTIAAAAGVFFAVLIGMFRTAGADLWAAIVLALAGVAVLLYGTASVSRRRS